MGLRTPQSRQHMNVGFCFFGIYIRKEGLQFIHTYSYDICSPKTLLDFFKRLYVKSRTSHFFHIATPNVVLATPLNVLPHFVIVLCLCLLSLHVPKVLCQKVVSTHVPRPKTSSLVPQFLFL